jgi:Cyclic nucleotide-binding domain
MTDRPTVDAVCDDRETLAEPFFCGLAKQTPGHTDSVNAAEEYPRGELLFAEGQEPRCVYVVCRGRVKLSTCSGDARVLITDLAGTNCTACHKHTRPFQHPVNLGDLSRFKCVDCHAGKVWTAAD